MIHQVQASKEDVLRLRQVVNLQLALLELATDEPKLASWRENSVGNVESKLRSIFSDEQAAIAAKWVTRKGRKNDASGTSTDNHLFAALKVFASHSNISEKQAALTAIRADVELLYEPTPARLKFSIDDKSPIWCKAVGVFFVEFYEALGTKRGLPGCLFIPFDQKANYRRWDFIDGFTAANDDLRICAVCDSTAYRASFTDKPYVSLEHYFPKSKYPHLATHPYNLIPICPYCNSGAAGTKDPLDDAMMDLLALVLPYQAQPGLSQQAYIRVVINRDLEKHPMALKFASTEGSHAEKLIESFEYIYQVEERWNNELDWIDQHVFRRITQFLIGDIQGGLTLADPAFLADRLRLLMAATSRYDLKRDPFGFVVIWLLHYHISEIENAPAGRLTPLHQGLISWAQKQAVLISELRNHATELVNRVPRKPESDHP